MATQQCVSYVDMEVLDRYSLIPALFVVCVLHTFQYFKEKKLELIPPFLSLIGDKDKKMIAMGFGEIANSIFLLIVNQSGDPENTWGEITIHAILFAINVIVIGVVTYPIFMCLQFPYKFIASICGVLYVLYRFIVLLLRSAHLENCSEELYRNTLAIRFAEILPNILCFLALILMFLVKIVKCIRHESFEKTTNSTAIAGDKELKHLRQVLQKYKISNCTSIRSSLIRVVKDISKMPTIFILAIVVILILYYYEVVASIYWGIRLNIALSSNEDLGTKRPYVEALSVAIAVAATVSVLVYLGILFQLIRSHEQDLKALFAGKITSHNDMANLHPRSLVMSNIVYPGFLVAYMLWGLISLYLLVAICTFIIYMLAYFAVKLEMVEAIIVKFLKWLYRIILVPLLVYIVQWLMTKFLFCQRDSNELVMLRNIKLYHMTIYFNFFYNIVMGVLSCLKRSLIGFAISFLFLGRIDRSSFAFFKRFDKGYRAYIGFLRMEALYKNPLMRCFIQFLNESTDANRNEFPQQTKMTEKLLTNKFKRARNRWHLAYTLINNQSLIDQRAYQKANPSFKEIDDNRTSSYTDTYSRTKLVFT